MRITHNISAINAQNSLFKVDRAMQKSIAKLSTGLRINSAADDAAGLGISENLRKEVRGAGQALQNTQDALSLLQVADGALTEQADILQRMRELVVQAKNDTYTSTERAYMGNEFKAMYLELDRIAKVTNYNGMQILASFSGISQITGDSTPKVIANSQTNPTYGSAAENVMGAGDNATTRHFSFMVGTSVNAADDAAFIAASAGFDSSAQNFLTVQFAEMDGKGLFAKNAPSVSDPMSQLCAGNVSTRNPFGWYNDPSFLNLGEKLDYILELLDGSAGNTTTGIGTPLFRTGSDTTGLARVNTMRAYIGATINRLEHNVNNLLTSQVNQQAAESQIRDADMANEMTTFTKNQILTQSATAMLSQANATSQQVLSLLR